MKGLKQERNRKLSEFLRISKKFKDEKPAGINTYSCDTCLNVVKTNDVHHGTTPFMMDCTDNCGGTMKSSFYEFDLLPDEPVTYEWYRPSIEVFKKMLKKDHIELEHLILGGLILRKKL